MGLRSLDDGYVPPILDVAKLDRKLLVSNAESLAGLRALVDREGIFAGVSSGRGRPRRRRLADELDEGVVVCILADGGWKYLSADFWDALDADTGDGARPLVVVPAAIRARAGAARRRGGAERGLRPDRPPRRAPRSATSPASTPPRARTASSCARPTRASCSTSRTRATSSPSSTRTRPTRLGRRKTDLANIGLWEGRPYLILSRPTGELCAWTIRAGAAEPLPLEISA